MALTDKISIQYNRELLCNREFNGLTPSPTVIEIIVIVPEYRVKAEC
jgi:hypothetical protein